MWKTYLIAMMIAGFVLGIAAGIGLNGFSDPATTLSYGFVGALIFSVAQTLITISSKYNAVKTKADRLPTRRKPRKESEGSFSDRMERFAANVQQDPKAQPAQSKIPLWLAEDCEKLEPSPPKSIGIIRMLLHRIRKVLTGN